MDMQALWLFLHVASVAVWVGGMFFAYVCLRPVAATQLPPPLRLALWAGVFERFFPFVWAAVALLLASGFTRLFSVGFAAAPRHWHLMMGVGVVMMLIFMHVFFAPYARLKRAVAAQDWPAGGAALAQIRKLVGLNLALGGANIGVATVGRWFAG
ncbi:MAG: CopD family protein [Rhodocyclaceae bacterium]|nr:CopD family protein [Rhodocyclaceae bacterium]MBX3670611.1 CopD family protein [Rhodocyclaceae bacterium]